MTIRVSKSKSVRTEVECFIPTDDNEAEQKALLYVWFKIQPKSVKKQRERESSEKLKIWSQIRKGQQIDELLANGELYKDSELDYLREDITKIEGIEIELEDDGATRVLSDYSEEYRDEILELSYARKAIAQKWLQVQNDEIWKREKEKN